MSGGLLDKFVAGVDRMFDAAEAIVAPLPERPRKHAADDREVDREAAQPPIARRRGAPISKLPVPKTARFRLIEAIEDGEPIFVVTNGVDVAEAKTRDMADRLLEMLNAEVGHSTALVVAQKGSR